MNIFSLKHGDRERGRVLKTPLFYLSPSPSLSLQLSETLRPPKSRILIFFRSSDVQTSKRIIQFNPTPKILPLGLHILTMIFTTLLFLPARDTYTINPGLQLSKNGYFMARSRPNGRGWLQAKLVHLDMALD